MPTGRSRLWQIIVSAHTARRRNIRRFFIVVVTLALAVQVGAPSASADPGRDTSGLNRDIPLPPAMAAILAQKRQLATEFAHVRAGLADRAAFETHFAAFLSSLNDDPSRSIGVATTSTTLGGGKTASLLAYPTAKYLNVTESAQANTYYCGPAAGYALLGFLGPSTSAYFDQLTLSQGSLATDNYFETDRWGNTPLTSGLKAFPVPQALNRWRQGTDAGYYEAVTWGSVNTATFINDLQIDIYAGYPLLGNANEVAGSPHLVGHPTDQNIQHWMAIYGYSSNGDNTSYADSVAGTTFWSWSGSVPAYSGYTTSTLVTSMLAGMGYIW